MAKHIWHGPEDHKDPDESDRCQACVLSLCKVCGGAEGDLTTDCPGRVTTEGEREEVMAGVLDFKDGQWIRPRPFHWQDAKE